MLFRIQVIFLLFISSSLWSQQVAINNIIATDYKTTDDDVLEIKFVEQLPNLPFIVAWIDEEGKQYALQFVTTEDKLILPLTGQKGWKGEIGLIGVSINNVEAQIRRSSFNDKWRTFMLANIMTPGSINFTQAYQLYGYPFRWICLGLAILFLPFLLLKFKNIRISLLLAFFISLSIYDMRSMKNRWDIMTYLSGQDYKFDILKDLDIFLSEARNIIGNDPWTKEPLSGVLNSYCTYQLADLDYKPPRTEIVKEAQYIITTKPAQRRVVYNHGRYFLISLKADQ